MFVREQEGESTQRLVLDALSEHSTSGEGIIWVIVAINHVVEDLRSLGNVLNSRECVRACLTAKQIVKDGARVLLRLENKFYNKSKCFRNHLKFKLIKVSNQKCDKVLRVCFVRNPSGLELSYKGR